MPLDETGLRQAAALGRALRGEPFERAVASDLRRARTTAQIVLAARADAMKLELEPLWREFDFGRWEGSTWSEIVTRFSEAESSAPSEAGRLSPSGGESFGDVVARVSAAIATLRATPVANALVVTHAGPLHALLRLAYESESKALAERFLPASINRFRLGAGGISVVRLNEPVRTFPL